MESSSNSAEDASASRWSDPPPDILAAITTHFDSSIGILRMRSVCRSWRSAVPLLLSSSPQFPLKIPFPLISSTSGSRSSPPRSHLSLVQRSVYLLSPIENLSHGFLVKLEERTSQTPNSFFLLDPLGSCCLPCELDSRINLLEYMISLVCKSYAFDPAQARVPFKKVVVSTNFCTNGDFVVLGLSRKGGLWVWRLGDENWSEIVADGQFDDVISYEGKFFATAGQRGRLVMINSRLEVVYMVQSLMYGTGKCTHLVESDGELYLVNRVWTERGFSIGVFKLDEKRRFWDWEPNLNEGVFFIGSDANFAVSRKDYGGCVRDCIYFKNTPEESPEHHDVFDMRKGTTCSLTDFEPVGELYMPPWCWFPVFDEMELGV